MSKEATRTMWHSTLIGTTVTVAVSVAGVTATPVTAFRPLAVTVSVSLAQRSKGPTVQENLSPSARFGTVHPARAALMSASVSVSLTPLRPTPLPLQFCTVMRQQKAGQVVPLTPLAELFAFRSSLNGPQPPGRKQTTCLKTQIFAGQQISIVQRSWFDVTTWPVQMSLPVAVAVSVICGQSLAAVVTVRDAVQVAPGAKSAEQGRSVGPSLLLLSWITTFWSGTSPSFVTVKFSV